MNLRIEKGSWKKSSWKLFLLWTDCLCPTPKNSYLTSNVMVLGGGAFGRYLGLEVIKVECT